MRTGSTAHLAMAVWLSALAFLPPASASEAKGSARSIVSGPSTESRFSQCVPVEVRTTHGGRLLPNTRLARIENGRVPCLHVEEGTVASCLFSTGGDAVSGSWLDGPEGEFAQIGQAVSLDGKPGGDYIVAARVGAGNSVSCSESTGMDTAGRVSPGIELGVICTVEDILQEWNALSVYGWFPLINYSELQVCAANDPALRPHPDGLDPVRSYALPGSSLDNVFCFTGAGASLNDINGTERDETTNYLAGEAYCHVVISGGFEVPGAKRPATKSFPAPGIVNVKSLITWRPVNPNVEIAN
ncbi:MAG: hypothetical protein ABIV06_10420 [Thermoanaerobaculia bacterium]